MWSRKQFSISVYKNYCYIETHTKCENLNTVNYSTRSRRNRRRQEENGDSRSSKRYSSTVSWESVGVQWRVPSRVLDKKDEGVISTAGRVKFLIKTKGRGFISSLCQETLQ